jgi:hypothetical protein
MDGLAFWLGEASQLKQQMDVGEVEGLAAEVSEVSHWAERRMVVGEVTGLVAERLRLYELSLLQQGVDEVVGLRLCKLSQVQRRRGEGPLAERRAKDSARISLMRDARVGFVWVRTLRCVLGWAGHSEIGGAEHGCIGEVGSEAGEMGRNNADERTTSAKETSVFTIGERERASSSIMGRANKGLTESLETATVLDNSGGDGPGWESLTNTTDGELGEVVRATTGFCRVETSSRVVVQGWFGADFFDAEGPGEVGAVFCTELAGELGLLTRSSVMGDCGPLSILRFSDEASGDVGDEVGDEVEEAES